MQATAPDRKRMLDALLSSATQPLTQAYEALSDTMPQALPVRGPEIGMVMLRGRTGGDGAPFNLGEATVTRAAVRLGSGHVGYAYLLGRDPARARLAAVLDAVQQSGGTAAIERCFADPVRRRIAHDRARGAARTAATRVDFFTLVRGED